MDLGERSSAWSRLAFATALAHTEGLLDAGVGDQRREECGEGDGARLLDRKAMA